jgi:hypothetical protein
MSVATLFPLSPRGEGAERALASEAGEGPSPGVLLVIARNTPPSPRRGEGKNDGLVFHPPARGEKTTA